MARLGVGAAVAGAGVAVTAAARVGVPSPSCPFRALTGLECPGCGATRCVLALSEGDVLAALDHNLLLPVLLVVFAAAWGAWVARAGGWDVAGPLRWRHSATAAAVVLVGFWMARLVAWGPLGYLASGTY